MKNIIKYELLAEATNKKLTTDVNTYLKKGWTIHGYPFVVDGLFFQALVLRKETKINGKQNKNSRNSR